MVFIYIFIVSPFKKSSAIQIYDERQHRVCSSEDDPIKHNTLIYPHQRLLISNQKLPSPVYEYWMMYKPKGMRGDLNEHQSQNRSISRWIQCIAQESTLNEGRFRLRLVGRLDIDCHGLLLCTNDGVLTDFLKSPNIGLERTYRCDITRNHHENKFSNIWTLQTKGTQLKKDIGWIDAVKIKPRGRLDDVDSFDLDKDGDSSSDSDDEKDDKNVNAVGMEEDEVEAMKGGEKYYRKYLRSLKRKTRWDISIQHGQHKIMKRMIGNLGFNVVNIERIGYGPFLMGEDGSDFKQWTEGKRNEGFMVEFEEKREEQIDNDVVRKLVEFNTARLSEKQVSKLWETVGGVEVGIIHRLNSLLERADKVNDTKFVQWLKEEHNVNL